MLTLQFSPIVTNALMKAFPKYSVQKANSKIQKYVSKLEQLMRKARLNKPKKRSKRTKTYTLEAKVLWDNTGQLKNKQMTTKTSVHKLLLDLKVPLVINTNPNFSPSNKELAKFKTTKYLTITDESLIDKMRKMTIQERHDFLDTPSQNDIDEITNYLKDFRSLSAQERNDRYDLVDVDVESVKNYILKLARGEVFFERFKQESDADSSEYILRIAQLNNGQLPQLKEKSDFGRTYYKNLSAQNVSKSVRKAFLGDSWEYDCKSCSASWKMAFSQEYCDSKKRNKKTVEQAFSAMTLFLQYKAEFFDEVINKTFLAQYPYSYENKVSVIKDAMTAIGFGAKLSTGSYKAKDGEIKFSSLYEVFDEKMDVLTRFTQCTIVREYCNEQQTLNKYIVSKFSTDLTWLADMEASSKKRKRKTYKPSQQISWLFQHAETEMMNIVRDELQKLGKTVLANVHDAIVVRERLTASELLKTEKLVRRITKVQYFALGETPYVRCV